MLRMLLSKEHEAGVGLHCSKELFFFAALGSCKSHFSFKCRPMVMLLSDPGGVKR